MWGVGGSSCGVGGEEERKRKRSGRKKGRGRRRLREGEPKGWMGGLQSLARRGEARKLGPAIDRAGSTQHCQSSDGTWGYGAQVDH